MYNVLPVDSLIITIGAHVDLMGGISVRLRGGSSGKSNRPHSDVAGNGV
jgi:hypothetical protein